MSEKTEAVMMIIAFVGAVIIAILTVAIPFLEMQ